MRKLLIVMLLLTASTVMAQSDCYAPNCGMVPLMNFNNENGGVTELYLYYDSSCDTYFRIRFSPVEGEIPEPVYFQLDTGEDRLILSEFMSVFDGYEARGTLIVDWATYTCVPRVLGAAVHRLDKPGTAFGCPDGTIFYNIDKPQRHDADCHIFYVNAGESSRFHVYNEDDFGIQTLRVGSEYYLVHPRETIEIEIPWGTYFQEICIGEVPPGPSFPGFDPDLPLYIEGLSVSEDGDVHRIINLE